MTTMRQLACLVPSLLLVGSAFARPLPPTARKAPAAAPAQVVEATGTVRGRVVTPWGLGISQRLVRIGEERTFTDGEGRFTFENVPHSYDVEVMERSGLHATAYYGLTRRDPVLTHQAWPARMDGFRAREDRPAAAGTGRIAGKAEPLKEDSLTRPTNYFQAQKLSFIYVLPDGDSAIRLGECSPHGPGRADLAGCSTDGAYDCELPDFGSLGGMYCIAIGQHLAQTQAMRCGGQLGMKDFSIPSRPPPPQLTIGDKADANRILSWSGEGQVFELNLGHDFMGTFVRVYTKKRAFTWSELAALGVDFAWNRAASIEGIKVTALLPYASMDDLVSGRGPLAMGTSWSTVESDQVYIRLPGGFKAATIARHPSNFKPDDPRSVPTCSAPDDPALAVDDLRTSMANTRVTVRGHLVCGGGSSCTEGGCITGWRLVGAANPRRGILLQRAEDVAPLEDHAGLCDSPNHPDIEVRTTGFLLSWNPRASSPKNQPTEPHYLLDQVSICAFRPPHKP